MHYLIEFEQIELCVCVCVRKFKIQTKEKLYLVFGILNMFYPLTRKQIAQKLYRLNVNSMILRLLDREFEWSYSTNKRI